MKTKKINAQKLIITTTVLFFISLFLKIISVNKEWIERFYSTSLYSKLSLFLRTLTGWLSFSLGDIVYVAAIVYFLLKLTKWIGLAFQKKVSVNAFLFSLVRITRAGLLLYIIFSLFWGLNYGRIGISSQLHITPTNYTTAELKSLTSDLIKKVNAAYSTTNMDIVRSEKPETIFAEAISSYKNVSYYYPFLTYNQPSVKPALFSSIDNYFGVAGYYNPFTGEAQINTSIPRFLLPFIITHEIAHQLGYADEDEANFVAYFVSKNSSENGFRYSAYFALFNYANDLLFSKDSLSAKANFTALDSLVKRDETDHHKLLDNDSASGAHYSTRLYNYYLETNTSLKKLSSYDDVIALLIAYQKAYGDL